MKTHIFNFLFISLFSFSFLFAGQESTVLGTGTASLNSTSSLSNDQIILFDDYGETKDPVIKLRRKENRMQIGYDIIDLGFQTAELLDDTYCCSLIIAAPVLVIGTGILIWGALTKDPTKERRRR